MHSPVTALVARSVADIAARDPSLQGDVFAKVGDSLTASGDFLRCFARDPLELGAQGEVRATIEHFRAGNARGVDPYRRLSWAATIGWSAWQVLHGSTPPLAREHADVRPRFALVQFGTNDIEIGALHAFSDHLLDIVDWLGARGTIPILFTLPPRLDDARANGEVPRYSAAIRLAAMARRVPLVDFGEALRSLPHQGIGPDGIHPTSHQGRRGRDACDLGEEGLKSGYNLRNLLAVQALARARQALTAAPATLDPELPPLAGSGDAGDPHPIASLPFFDVVDEQDGPEGALRDYSGCAGARAAPGRERVYRLTLTTARRVEVIGFDRGGAEADVALLEGRAEGSACRYHGRRSVSAALGPGTWFVVVDPVSVGTGRRPGETLVAVL
ncbi:MAG: hypothetical protein IT376_17780 [Polyangiaceae bacterium]|nr:hypothetical protein [Polyangiaceae bacterium]